MSKIYFGILWIVLAAGIALGSYVLKNHVVFLEKDLAATNKRITENLQEIHMLKVEFASLTRPDRINRLATKYLNMHPMAPNQFLSIYNIPYRGENL